MLLDYDAKAEDAVDYEDFDEQYEGPEIQGVSEEDYLLSKKNYILSESSLQPPTSDNEDYDEDVEEELEKEPVVSDKILEFQTASLSGLLLGDSHWFIYIYIYERLIWNICNHFPCKILNAVALIF